MAKLEFVQITQQILMSFLNHIAILYSFQKKYFREFSMEYFSFTSLTEAYWQTEFGDEGIIDNFNTQRAPPLQSSVFWSENDTRSFSGISGHYVNWICLLGKKKKLGFSLNKNSIDPLRIEFISRMPSTENHTTLRWFLGKF